MPATWMTKEQKGWLHARIPQYLESQRMSRIPRALKAIHQEWSDTWPEHDVVCPPKAGEPNLPLTPEQETEVAKITARRYGVGIFIDEQRLVTHMDFDSKSLLGFNGIRVRVGDGAG